MIIKYVLYVCTSDVRLFYRANFLASGPPIFQVAQLCPVKSISVAGF